jgi:ammonia channel protein AmtB
MTPGLAFFYGGMVSPKNVISTMLQCFIALGVVSVLWTVVGPDLFLTHLAALALVSGFTFGGSWLLYRLVDLITPLRVDERHEQLGLDLTQHGETIGLFEIDESTSA